MQTFDETSFDGLRLPVAGAPERVEMEPAEASRFIKAAARYCGAVAVGICEMKPHHYYSHQGHRGAEGHQQNTHQ